jgi:hypothetical protein
MDIYLAADYGRKHEMRGCRDVLEAVGHKVVSRWIDNEDSVESAGIGGKAITDTNREVYAVYARVDAEDIRSADLFVLFTTGKLSRGGRHAELGIALERRMNIAVVGPLENVFQCSDGIVHYPTWFDFVRNLARGWAD